MHLTPSIAAVRRLVTGRARGQSLVEFAIVLPLLLAIVGITVDFARVYQAAIALNSATRNASEYVATFCPENAELAQRCLPNAEGVARTMICAETASMPGSAGSGLACTSPVVQIVELTTDPSAPGGTPSNPISSATVHATLEFRMLFNYPLLTRNGAWTIAATESFSVVQGH